MKFLLRHKKGLFIGFIFGAIIAPLLATLGLISGFFESIRPILIGPFDLLSKIIPDVQVSQDTYYVPVYKWFFTLLFNGLVYSVLGFLISLLFEKHKTSK